MFGKRVLFIVLVASIVMLAVSAAPSNARPEPSREPAPSLAPSSYQIDEELRLSPDGEGERYLPAVAYNYVHSMFKF